MATIVIITQRVLGHVLPALSIGTELRERGHQVYFLSHHSNRALIKNAGLHYMETGWGMFPDKFILEQFEEIVEKLKNVDVNIMINDSALCAPAYFAEQKGIPWISLQGTIPSNSRAQAESRVEQRLHSIYTTELNRIREAKGLEPLRESARQRGDLAGWSPYAHLIMVLPALLDDGMILPPASHVVGPCFFNNSGGCQLPLKKKIRPTVLICTSSLPRLEFQELTARYVNASIEAFWDQPFEVFISAPLYNGYKKLPEHIQWVSGHPTHDSLLPLSDVVITHGGSGTLQRAIMQGVPMLILPLGEDHSKLARKCREIGVSITLSPNTVTSENLLSGVLQLMRANQYKHSITRLKRMYRALNPTREAAEVIEQLLISNQRGNPEC